MTRSRNLLTAALVLSALIIPAASQANVGVYGCTAGPYRPTFAGTTATYAVYVSCTGGQSYLLNWQLQELFGSNWIIVRDTTRSSGVVGGSRWWTAGFSPFDGGARFRTVISKFQVNPAGTGWFSADVSAGGTAVGSASGGSDAP